jgi:hypothetical protein
MVRIEVTAMDALRPKYQIGEWQVIKCFGLRAIPVAPDRRGFVAAVPIHHRSMIHCACLLIFVDKI